MSWFYYVFTDVTFYIDLSLFCYLFFSLLRFLILESTIMKSVGESSNGKRREPIRESPFSTFLPITPRSLIALVSIIPHSSFSLVSSETPFLPLSFRKNQEPITPSASEQLPYQAYVTAFLGTSLFLDTFWGTFSRENRISPMSMSAFKA